MVSSKVTRRWEMICLLHLSYKGTFDDLCYWMKYEHISGQYLLNKVAIWQRRQVYEETAGKKILLGEVGSLGTRCNGSIS